LDSVRLIGDDLMDKEKNFLFKFYRMTERLTELLKLSVQETIAVREKYFGCVNALAGLVADMSYLIEFMENEGYEMDQVMALMEPEPDLYLSDSDIDEPSSQEETVLDTKL